MTNVEYVLKYPIGIRIKYIGIGPHDPTGDYSRVGKVVGYSRGNRFPLIFLPESKNVSSYSTPRNKITWETSWEHIELFAQKGQQLVFAFMEE